ncbi:MAG: cobalamin B12-binding domain-containing protein [Solirubrobacterales bacterium]|nr:cobalamin B12-binding domain-containing protein [Solirubrobacterales bacterium]
MMIESREPSEQRLRSAMGAARTDLSQQDRWRTALVMALYAGNLEQAKRVVHAAARDVEPVTVLDEVLAPAMHDIGALWERDHITVADEHLATFVIQRLLAEMSSQLKVAEPGSRETVLLATPTAERHAAGLLMAYDVLSGAGYETICLGVGVPRAALVAALARHRPALVGLSATMPFAAELMETVDAVLEALPTVQVLLGGAAAAAAPRHARVHHVPLLAELVQTAERALAGGRPDRATGAAEQP